MLEFIDRFSEQRYLENQNLQSVSIWVGTVNSKKSLDAYLSAQTPEDGQFAKDAGDDWYDHDFIAAHYQKSAVTIASMIESLAQTYHFTPELAGMILQTLRDRGVEQANAWVCLSQHIYRGDKDKNFNGLMFAGSYEYEIPQAPAQKQYSHLFAGITSVSTLPELDDYAWGGQFETELGCALEDIELYGHGLREKWEPLSISAFFSLDTVKNRILLSTSLDAVQRACAEKGFDKINAFISGTNGKLDKLAINADQRFAGLLYLGVFESERLY